MNIPHIIGMGEQNIQRQSAHTGNVSDEERREFLKVLGVTGTVAAGGATLEELNGEITTGAAAELAPVGQAIRSDLTGELDTALVAEQQAALTAGVNELPASLEHGLPGEAATEPRAEFSRVAAAGMPVYEHLRDVGFFASAAEHLPAFNLESLGSAVETFVGSETLVEMADGIGTGEQQGADLLATVIGNAEQLEDYHWIATEDLPGGASSIGESFPSAPQAAAGGALLWLDDIDQHLYQKSVFLTEQIHADAVWHGESMATGFYLMGEAATLIGEESGAVSDAELGALLTTGFAIQAITQGLLPQDVYWVTEQMRAPRS